MLSYVFFKNYNFFHFTVTEANFLYHSLAIDLLIILVHTRMLLFITGTII